MREVVDARGQRAHDRRHRAGARRFAGAARALLDGAAVGLEGVEAGRVHGAVEEHDLAGGLARALAQLLEAPDLDHAGREASFRRRHAAAQGQDRELDGRFLARQADHQALGGAALPARHAAGLEAHVLEAGREHPVAGPLDGARRARGAGEAQRRDPAQLAQELVGLPLLERRCEDALDRAPVGIHRTGIHRMGMQRVLLDRERGGAQGERERRRDHGAEILQSRDRAHHRAERARTAWPSPCRSCTATSTCWWPTSPPVCSASAIRRTAPVAWPRCWPSRGSRRGRCIASTARSPARSCAPAARRRSAPLEDLFREQRIQKTYWALVRGRPPADRGELVFPILEEGDRARVSARGKPARTRYRTLRELPEATELEIELLTGRRNQIRVHFAHAGAALVGRDQVRPAARRSARRQAPRAALLEALLRPPADRRRRSRSRPRCRASSSSWRRPSPALRPDRGRARGLGPSGTGGAGARQRGPRDRRAGEEEARAGLEQARAVDGLGQVLVAAGREALLAVAGHGVRRQGDDRPALAGPAQRRA